MDTMTATSLAWLLVLIASINSCIGNLLLKKSSLIVEPGSGFIRLLISPWFIGGLFFFAINVILFTKALEKIPVSIAYPALAGSTFAMLIFAARWFFGEQLGLYQYIGLIATVFGIFMLSR